MFMRYMGGAIGHKYVCDWVKWLAKERISHDKGLDLGDEDMELMAIGKDPDLDNRAGDCYNHPISSSKVRGSLY
jgi:hypothetical protein